MSRFPLKFFILAIFLTLVMQSTQGTLQTYAQNDVLEIIIAQPAEGETFYAGPSSIVYTIPVNGRLSGPFADFTQVEVYLEIYQGAQLIDHAQAKPFPDGTFTFHTTVNPEASQGNFTAELKECEYCHRTTELGLHPGSITLKFIARLPSGESATAERNIFVDHSKYTMVPIRVLYKDNPQQTIPNIPVSGSTWLYLWRARHFSGTTDEMGQVMLRVEALTLAPTHYTFQVDPVIIDGVIYETHEPVEITLPASPQDNELISLYIEASKGEITGNLSTGPQYSAADIPIYAIQLPGGESLQTTTDANGHFIFPELSIGEYVLTPDWTTLSTSHLQAENRIIDLELEPKPQIQISITYLNGSPISGRVKEVGGSPLPFAWASLHEFNQAEAVIPWTGQWTIYGDKEGKKSIWINAPGYYSKMIEVDESIDVIQYTDVELKRRSDTKSITWGTGEIVVPKETTISENNSHLLIDKGWLWGIGGDNVPKILQTTRYEIILHEGTFALEIPPRGISWFYLMAGKAEVFLLDTEMSVMVNPGEMLALNADKQLLPIPQDITVFHVFHPESDLPIIPIWDRGITAIIRNSLEWMGIGAAQIVTIITYAIAILLLISTPFVGIRLWWKRQREKPTPKVNNENS